MKAEDLVKQRKEERRERKYYSAKDIRIDRCNEGKESICSFDPSQGTEGKKRKKTDRRSDEMISPKVKIITLRPGLLCYL